MSLPCSSTMAAEDAEKAESAARVGARAGRGRRARPDARAQILTRKAFENAIAVVMAVGGSTNAVLHLLAIAHAARGAARARRLRGDPRRVPVLCDLKPSGRYVATDLHRAGGIPQVMKMLLDARPAARRRAHHHRQDGGRDARGRARRAAAPDQDVIRPWANPLYAAGPPRDPARQPRDRGRGREDHRRQDARDHRARARVRVGGGAASRRSWPAGSGRGRGRDSLRGAEGRPGHARDALADLGHHRRGPGRLGRPASPTAASPAAPTAWSWATWRPRPPSAGTHRARARRRLDHDRRRAAAAAARRRRGRDRAPPRGLEAAGAAIHARRAREVPRLVVERSAP